MTGSLLSQALVSDGAQKKRGSPLMLTVANVAKTILGSGILSLSWAFFYSTMWPGLLFTVLIGFLAAFSYVMLGHCSEITGMRSYSAIWSHAFGTGFAWLPDLAVVTNGLLACLAYLIIIGDYLPRGLESIGIHWAPLHQRHVVILLVWTLILPLNFLRDLSALGYTSIIGTVGTLYTCLTLVGEAVERADDQADWQPFRLGPGIFLMMPTMAFAFFGHFNAPDLYQQLEGRSLARWIKVTTLAYGFCFLVIVACAVSGYIMFGSGLSLEGRSNVLTAPEFKGKPDVEAAYLATSFSVACSMPLQAQAARDAIEALWLRALPASAAAVDEGLRRSLLTLLCLTLTLALSMVCQELGLVAEITGAVQASLLMFILPSMMYLKLASGSKVGPGNHCAFLHRWIPMFSIATGITVGTLGVITAVLRQMGVDFSVML